MKDLQTLKKALILYLEEAKDRNIKDFTAIFDQYQGEDWQAYLDFSSETYCRNSVFCQAGFEVLVIAWKAGQGSQFHTHPKQGCLLKVLEGELTETRCQKGQTQAKRYSAGEISYIHDSIGVHKIENLSEKDAISLHIYAPGFFQAKILKEESISVSSIY